MTETTATETAAIEEAKAQAEAMAQGKRDAVNAVAPRGLLYVANTTANLLAYFETYDAELAERAADESISYATTEAYRRLLRAAQHPNGQAYRAELRERAEAEAETARDAEVERSIAEHEESLVEGGQRPGAVHAGPEQAAVERAEEEAMVRAETDLAVERVSDFVEVWEDRTNTTENVVILGIMRDGKPTDVKLTTEDLRLLITAARR